MMPFVASAAWRDHGINGLAASIEGVVDLQSPVLAEAGPGRPRLVALSPRLPRTAWPSPAGAKEPGIAVPSIMLSPRRPSCSAVHHGILLCYQRRVSTPVAHRFL